MSKKTHRKRLSVLRLSSDTSSTLPEYQGWHTTPINSFNPLDNPPDYPDSAEEADEDTDTDTSNLLFIPPSATSSPRLNPSSPRRSKRHSQTHKRRQSSLQLQQPIDNDPYLDSLLERSVHALEMSNTLLQSSISTQTSLSAILAHDSPQDVSLEAHARKLNSRIRDNWASDLDELTRDVESLFWEEGSRASRWPAVVATTDKPPRSIPDVNMSCSLPSSSSPIMKRSTRRPSLDLRLASDNQAAAPRLHYSAQHRSNLIAPPPRALTQYIASTQDSETIALPSTLGIRSASSIHHPDWRPVSDSVSTPGSLPPKLTDKPLEPSTPAYNMLSSFVFRPPPQESAPSSTSSFSPTNFIKLRRDSSASGEQKTRGRSSRSPTSRRSERGSRPSTNNSSCTQTPNHTNSPPPTIHIRQMTPPVEESSSSSSEGPMAKQTVKCLRKILDDQPPPPAPQPTSRSSSISQRRRAPAFMPRTPAPVAEAGTSTATASISRLFTKGTHSSSTRAPSPPRQSALKRASHSSPSSPARATATPSPSTSVLYIPEMVVKALGGGTGSGQSNSGGSGATTPSKRISFAELPESYASTRPEGVVSAFKEKQEMSRRKRAARKGGKGKVLDVSGEPVNGGSWWGGWLIGGAGAPGPLAVNLAKQQERMEDRTTRSWGGRMGAGFGSGLDEWAV